MPLAITAPLSAAWTAHAPLLAGMVGAALLPLAAWALTRRRPPPPAPPLPEAAAPSLPTASADQRRAVRRAGKPVKVLIVEGGAQPYEGLVIDRSAGGICLTVPRPIATGAALEVRPTLAQAGSPWAQAVVVHSDRLGAGVWRVGCRFSAPLPAGILHLFG